MSSKRSCTEVQSEPYVALDQQYIRKAEFQDVYDHAERTFTLLGYSDRARCHSWFHPPAMRDPRIHGKSSYWGFSGYVWGNKWELRHERAGQILVGIQARPTKENNPER